MPSGQNANLAAHNGKGVQAVYTTLNPETEETDVVSDILRDEDFKKTMAYGTSFSRVYATSQSNTLDAFSCPTDIDAISDMYIKINVLYSGVTTRRSAAPNNVVTGPNGNAGAAQGITSAAQLGFTSGQGGNITITPGELIQIIDKVQILLGSSVIQTIAAPELFAVNASEMVAADIMSMLYAQDETGIQLYSVAPMNPTVPQVLPKLPIDQSVSAYVRIPSFTSGGPGKSHLVSAATNQSLKVNIIKRASIPHTIAVPQSRITFTTDLYCRTHVVSNYERLHLRSNPISRRIKMTQSMFQSITTATPAGSLMTEGVPHEVELDPISLMASHLLISLTDENNQCVSANGQIPKLVKAELFLNGTSYNGEMDGSFMLTVAPGTIGLNSSSAHIELFHNSAADIFTTTQVQGGIAWKLNPEDSISYPDQYYVYPIASVAYGTDSVPFNKFDSVRLRVTVLNSAGGINVACVGTSVAFYKNNTAAFNFF